MAMDKIRQDTERMAADLQQWVHDKLFSISEARLIAKKRTNFEFITAAHNSEIVDFLRFIKFEIDLDKLLQTRRRKFKKKHDAKNATGICRIFHKAVSKFHDRNLFVLFINFCLERKFYGTLRTVFARGVKLFPTEPDIWNMAANFEFDINKNVTAARVLMQLALRFNKGSEKVWLNFFALELRYWHKMQKRGAKNNFDPLEPNTKNSIEIDAELRDPSTSTSPSPSLSSSTPFAECQIPKMLYKSAIQASPHSYPFRAKFLEIARRFTNTDALVSMISDNIVQDFPLNEQALATHADLQLRFSGKFFKASYAKACAVYENSIKTSKSATVWELYIKYMREKLGSLSLDHTASVKYLTEKLLETCQKAPPSPSTYLVWIDALISTGDVEQANKVANRSVKKFPKSAELRLNKIELQIKSGNPKAKILSAFERAVKKADASAELWYRYVQWMTLNDAFDTSHTLTGDDMETELDTKHADKAVVSIAVRCLKSLFTVVSADDYNLLKVNLFNTIFFHFGLLQARNFLEYALKTPPTTLAFCVHALAIEEAQHKDVFSAQTVRKLYEEIVRNYGEKSECEDIWLRYIQFEQNQLQITRAGDLYWRAKNALTNPAAFMAKYDQIKQR